MKERIELARMFSANLLLALEKDTFLRMVAAHIEGDYKNRDTCVSHDYCDSNISMLDAFKQVSGEELKLGNHFQITDVNQAWDLAKQNDFYVHDFVHAVQNTPDISPWDFVEKWYPDYPGSQDIADNDDLLKLIDREDNEASVARLMLHEDYEGNYNHPQLKIDFLQSTLAIYERAMCNFLEVYGAGIKAKEEYNNQITEIK